MFSDIPNDRLLRWDETTGAVGVFRSGAGFANGNTVDRQGRLVTCEQGNRRVCHVYRVDPGAGDVRLVADDFCRPNGIAFSPDEQRLFVADTRQEPSHIRVFDVGDDGALTGGGIFAECTVGRFDGFRLDSAGRIWAGAWDGVHCFAPDGARPPAGVA